MLGKQPVKDICQLKEIPIIVGKDIRSMMQKIITVCKQDDSANQI